MDSITFLTCTRADVSAVGTLPLFGVAFWHRALITKELFNIKNRRVAGWRRAKLCDLRSPSA
jgi:hypothetical protein